VREVSGAGAELLLRLAGVDDRSQAEALRGARVEVDRSGLSPLGPGEYYLVDLLAAEVIGPEGRVGEVVGVRVNPSVDSVIVRMVDGSEAEQPLSAPFVARVDAGAGRIELSSLDGLIR